MVNEYAVRCISAESRGHCLAHACTFTKLLSLLHDYLRLMVAFPALTHAFLSAGNSR